MTFLAEIFHNFLYRPLFNLLILLYVIIPFKDFGITIIVLTILIRFLLYPFAKKAIKAQRDFSKIQPKIKEIQKKYKDDKEKQAREIMSLYQKEKINPFASFLPILVQMPILIALYWVFWHGFEPKEMSLLYDFIPYPGEINPSFLGIINLSHPNLFLALIAGFFQYYQAKTSLLKKKKSSSQNKPLKNKSDFSQILEKQMLYFFPFFTFLILLRIPAVVGLYWSVSTLFTIVQQTILFKKEDEEKKYG